MTHVKTLVVALSVCLRPEKKFLVPERACLDLEKMLRVRESWCEENFQLFENWCLALRTGCLQLRTGCLPPRTGCPPLRNGCPPLRTGFLPLRSDCLPRSTGCLPLRTECLPLRTGCLALVRLPAAEKSFLAVVRLMLVDNLVSLYQEA